MFVFIRKEIALFGLFATASLAAVNSREADPSNFKLYAYGGETIGGYPIFFADGKFNKPIELLFKALAITSSNPSIRTRLCWRQQCVQWRKRSDSCEL
jgi:hypothetical protein